MSSEVAVLQHARGNTISSRLPGSACAFFPCGFEKRLLKVGRGRVFVDDVLILLYPMKSISGASKEGAGWNGTLFESFSLFSAADLLLNSPKNFLFASLMVEYLIHALMGSARHLSWDGGAALFSEAE